jgi:hypothetical protein
VVHVRVRLLSRLLRTLGSEAKLRVGRLTLAPMAGIGLRPMNPVTIDIIDLLDVCEGRRFPAAIGGGLLN